MNRLEYKETKKEQAFRTFLNACSFCSINCLVIFYFKASIFC